MIDEINITNIFIETHDEYIEKYKYKNGFAKKYTAQDKYYELHGFVTNASYWSRQALLAQPCLRKTKQSFVYLS